ncbi:MAG: tetratricopeptide repeat protein [Treponema sp.]|nr:tetratricopeptide repeat protein [Treponema sp.]
MPIENILELDNIIIIENELMRQNNYSSKDYREFLISKYLKFVEDKDILDAYIKSALEPLDIVGQYIILQFCGLIISFFEHPMFKNKIVNNDKIKEMVQFIENFTKQNFMFIQELKNNIIFHDKNTRHGFINFISQNNLLLELGLESGIGFKDENILDIISRYPTKQPKILEHMTTLVFLPEIVCPLENKVMILFHLYFVIEYLNEFYFSWSYNEKEKSAEDLFKSGIIYSRNGDFIKAIERYKQAILLKPDYFEAIAALGLAHGKIGDYVSAVNYLLMCKDLWISDAGSGKDAADYVEILGDLSVMCLAMGDYTSAIKYLHEEKDIWERELDINQAKYIMLLGSLGAALYESKRDDDSAFNYLLKAIDMWKKTQSTDDLEYASLLHNLSVIYHYKRENKAALKYLLKSIKIREKKLGKDHHSYASSIRYLVVLYREMGDFFSASKILRESGDIWKKIPSKGEPNYTNSLYNLGLLFKFEGDDTSAEKFLLEVKDIWEQEPNREHSHYAVLLRELGSLYVSIGNYDSAELLYLQAKDLIEKIHGKDHLEYVSLLTGMCLLYNKMDKPDKAVEYHLEAMDITKKKLDIEHPAYAVELNNLGNLCLYIEEYGLAKEYILFSVYIMGKLGKKHPAYATSLNNLSIIYYYKGDYVSAKKYLTKSINIIKKTLGKRHPKYIGSLYNLSEVYLCMKDYTKALKVNIEAGRQVKNILIWDFSFLSEQQRSNYWDLKKDLLETSYLHSLNNPNPYSNSLNYDNTLFSKGLMLRTTNAVRDSIYNFGDHELIAQFEELGRIRKQITALQQSGNIDEKFILNLEQEADALDKNLTQKSAVFREVQADLTLRWQNVQDYLMVDEAAIEFVSFRLFNKKRTNKMQYAALIIRPGMDAPKWVPFCEEGELSNIFIRLTNRVDKLKLDDEDQSKKQVEILYIEYGQELYKTIWQPLEEVRVLEGVKTIYYSPSGLLHKLSFNAIPTPDGKRLSELYDMNLVSSTREVIYRHNKNTKNPASAAIYGGLLYDLPADRMRKEAKPYQNQETQTKADLPKDIPRNIREERLVELHFTRLECTMLESIRIHDQLINSKIRTDLYVAARGNKESFKELDKKKTGIIHLATHGFFIEDITKDYEEMRQFKYLGNRQKVYENPLMKSGLALSGANNAWSGKPIEGVENGVLFAAEIAEMNLLGAELIVLSACNTGLGEIKNGEGVFGLQRAFKLAGAETVVMSLWAVADKFTYKFMKTFYENWLKGKSKQEAFKETQKHFRADEQYSSPYYWAAFVMMD